MRPEPLISVLHPSRSRAVKSFDTIARLSRHTVSYTNIEFVISVDEDDPELQMYKDRYRPQDLIINKNRSCVDAINHAAKYAQGSIFVVISDDTGSEPGWPRDLLKALDGKSDFLLKTEDGIQDYIVTQTIMDRKYYERDGFIYHPDFKHQFADTYLTCLADIRGRLLFSKLKFPHLHYSYSGGKEAADALNHRNDATWRDGQDTFVKLMKQFTPEERNRITNKSMRSFMKHVGL